MSENTSTNQQNNTQLEGGTYEIIRKRLQKHGDELIVRLNNLNDARKNVFGAVETTLIASDRISTENNCLAADILALDNLCIFGYNVYMGLKSEVHLSDVFSLYEFSGNNFHEKSLEIIEDEHFLDDFRNMYRYYRHTAFVRFTILNAHLYMIFKIGKNHSDIKVFKWMMQADNTLQYIDDRSASEVRLPEQYEFEWQRTKRDMHRNGKHPHVSIQDRLFVETVGGDLTIKIEDNTQSGKGIYAEDVQYKEQSLDDGEYFFADLGNLIALKIRPYREPARYFIYNAKLQTVKRSDTLEDSAVLLPDGHGLIFSDGYFLQTGEFKRFDKQIRGMRFEKRIVSPNGEDYLFVFYHQATSEYILMSYNIIEQKVSTPILCNGYTCFPNGELCYFRAEKEPTKHHVIQIWQTPYTKNEPITNVDKDNFLFKIGNKDIVRAMAECHEILKLLQKQDSYSNLYGDLVKETTDVLDSYYWIDKSDTFLLNEPLLEIKKAATTAIDEFEKVKRIRQNTKEQVANISKKAEGLFTKTKRTRFDDIDKYVQFLANFRMLRGETISLKELRYIDTDWVNDLEQKLGEESERLSQSCVTFLLKPDALQHYHDKIAAQKGEIGAVTKGSEAKKLGEEIGQVGKELEMLIDIVSNLKIEDATHTTQIIDQISSIFVGLNQSKAKLKNRQKDLLSTEALAEFTAQLKLLDQSLINYLDISDTPQKCDEYLTKLMISLEELEGKYVDFQEFTAEISDKRELLYEAFETRKLSLIEAKNRRTAGLQSAANRIFKGIKNRLKNFKTVEDINAYFAADLMIDKVRDIAKQLFELEDTVKADDVQSQLKSLKLEGIRQLKDKQDLFVDGGNIIKMGKHLFSVNTQPLDLTIVERDGDMFFHLTGTNFFERIENEGFLQTKAVWNQHLISENEEVYRAEYLAYQVFLELMKGEGNV